MIYLDQLYTSEKQQFGTFAALVAWAETNVKTININRQVVAEASIAIPDSVQFRFSNGGNIYVDTGVALTNVPAPLGAPDWQVFTGPGTVTFRGGLVHAKAIGGTTHDMRHYGGDFRVGDIMLTAEGGLAVRYTNRSGATSVRGYAVCMSSSYDAAVTLITQNKPDPIGVFYQSGYADGSDAWIVVSGKGYGYFVDSVTRGWLARGFVTADSGYVAGQLKGEAVPTSPFATDKHFYEAGHVAESRTGAGLALMTLHQL